MDLDLRFETAFAASPDILALLEESERLWDEGDYAEPHRLTLLAYDLWKARYTFADGHSVYVYWKATRHGP